MFHIYTNNFHFCISSWISTKRLPPSCCSRNVCNLRMPIFAVLGENSLKPNSYVLLDEIRQEGEASGLAVKKLQIVSKNTQVLSL